MEQSRKTEEIKMQNYYNQIKNSPIFFGLSEEELKGMLACFNARIKEFENGEIIIRQGDMVKNIYLVLEGNVNIEKDSYWGRRIIVTQLGINDNIALAFVASKNVESSIDAVAVGKTKLLILTYEKCTTMCHNVCTKHKMLINNLFEIISKENIELLTLFTLPGILTFASDEHIAKAPVPISTTVSGIESSVMLLQLLKALSSIF